MNGLNHHDMNETNKFILLKYLATKGPLSRVELSSLSGLSKMTVTAIVNDYLAEGAVRECGSADSTGGRKATLLEICPTALLTLGVAIGRDMLKVGIVNLRGEILESEMIPFSSITSGEVLLSGVFYLSDKMMAGRYSKNICGIGVSCAGPLSVKEGMILNPPDFNGITDVPIVGALVQRYSLPVYIQNDMCTAALAESYFGNKKKCSSFLYVGIAAGIGGGVIIDQKLYGGAVGLAGAVGHTIVELNGVQCECGQRGCLEKYSGTKAIVTWAREKYKNDNLSWIELANGVPEKNEMSLAAIDRMIEYLGMALTNFQMVFDVQGIIIGGELYMAREYVVKKIREKLQSENLAWSVRRKVNVEESQLMSNAPFIGTAALVMENSLDAN